VDDLKITAELKSRLASAIGISSVTDISINSTNGVVTLAGEVASADVKSKTVSIASSIPKVVRVVDNIQVARPQTNLPRIKRRPENVSS
jgi:osmotically-inducible protein OsmY